MVPVFRLTLHFHLANLWTDDRRPARCCNPAAPFLLRVYFFISQRHPLLSVPLPLRATSLTAPTCAQTPAPRQIGFTGLQLAAVFGHYDVVRVLLRSGASVNLVEAANMWTPLHLAAIHGHPEVVQQLLSAKADPQTRDRSDLTVAGRVNRQLQELARLEHDAASQVLPAPAHANRPSPLTRPIQRRLAALGSIQRLLLKPHQRFEEAVSTANARAIETLVRAGEVEPDAVVPTSEVDEPDQGGPPPKLLHWEHTDRKLVLACLEKGAAVNAVGPGLHTPLHEACRLGRVDVARCLLDNGADVDARQAKLQTPLILAAAAGEHGTVSVLLAAGADRGARDEDGDTAFDCAADVAMMALLAAGAEKLGVAVLSGQLDNPRAVEAPQPWEWAPHCNRVLSSVPRRGV